MANLTAKRMQEMEEEMNRFEEEILSTKAAEAEAAANRARNNSRKMIIGAGTFSQVQAQIAGKAPSSPAIPSTRPPEEKPHVDLTVTGPPLPPPPPPPLDSHSSAVTAPSSSAMFNLRPPPPPPAFVPHQLQHRPMMPPRPPFPPRPMPPGPPYPPGMPTGNIPRHPGMMPPPPPHPNLLQRPPMPPGSFMSPPMMSMNLRNNVPTFHFNQNLMQSNSTATTTSTPTQSSAFLEKPKVVYAAAPVKRIITEVTSKPETIAPVVVEKPPEAKKPRLEQVVKKQVLPGIELNVPVEEIEAEKKLHYQAPAAAAPAPVEAGHGESASQETSKKKEKKKKFVRMAAGTVWEDQTLAEWDQDDFRLFCGDLGNEVMDETLARAFSKYPSFVKAKVVRDKRTSKTKGFGFVSFKDPNDFMKAMREMNGKYVGNRPIKLRKSTWRDRQIDVVKKKDKEKKKLGFR